MDLFFQLWIPDYSFNLVCEILLISKELRGWNTAASAVLHVSVPEIQMNALVDGNACSECFNCHP
jgi:hypothetical protein